MEAARKLSLWQISDELTEIGEQIAELHGELTPELEARLDAMDGAFADKVESIALFVRECEANAEAAILEVERLDRIADSFKRKAHGLKSYLHAAMKRTGNTKIKTHRVRVWTQANGRPSIRFVGDVSKLPPEFVKAPRPQPPEVDTQFAFVEYSAGATLPEGFVVEHGDHLRIG